MGVTSYGLQQIKKELQHLPASQLAEICLRLAKYKKENKELLAYLLFEAHDADAYVAQVKTEVDTLFAALPRQSYFMIKALRKILRQINKHVKFTGAKTAEIELLMYFCQQYLTYADLRSQNKPLRMIMLRQLEKIKTTIAKLHEDVQLDYSAAYGELLNEADKKVSWININQFRL